MVDHRQHPDFRDVQSVRRVERVGGWRAPAAASSLGQGTFNLTWHDNSTPAGVRAERVLLVLDQNLNWPNVRKKSPDLPPAALTEPPGMKWV